MQAIIVFLSTIVGLLENLFSTIVWTIKAIPDFVIVLVEFVAYCPSFLLAYLMISIALTVWFAVLKLF